MATYEKTVALIEFAEAHEDDAVALSVCLSAVYEAAPYLYGVELADMGPLVVAHHRERDAKAAAQREASAAEDRFQRGAFANMAAGRPAW